MTHINQRRSYRKPVNKRFQCHEYRNSLVPTDGKRSAARAIGKTDYLDKSVRGWGSTAPLAGKVFDAGIATDFVNGHRDMARSVLGAKKFVRTRIRFHENAAAKRMAHHARAPETQED